MAAPIWQLAIEKFIETETTDFSSITKGLQTKDVSLLSLIEYSGKHLTSDDTTTRGRLTHLLANVLHQCQTDLLSSQEVSLLITFFCERLVDHHSIQPHCIHGILALTSFRNIPQESAEVICRSIFQNVQNQTLSQSDRRAVYTIFSSLLSTHLKELQKMKGDFVLGYIQAMDSEKDPRNLIIAFSCARTIIQNFSLGVFVEEMFEVVSCYFPVDFTPPANDPYGITRDDLILGLRACLSASPKFGPLCIPLLLEKLSSDVQSAKLDSLQTLAVCAPVYGSQCVKEYQGSIFRCCKQEVFSSGSSPLSDSSLAALTSISATLSPKTGVSTTDSDVDEFIKDIFQDIGRHLKDEEQRLFSPTCRLIEAVQAGSGHACYLVLTKVIPILLDLHNQHSTATQRKKILEALLSFLECARSTVDPKVSKLLKECHGNVLTIILSTTSDSNLSLGAVAVRGLAIILTIPQMYDDEKKKVILRILSDLIFHRSAEIRTKSRDAIQVLTSVDGDLILRDLLPNLIQKLSTDSMEVDGCVSGSHDAVFEVLSVVVQSPTILRYVLEQILSYLRALSKENYPSDPTVLQKCVRASQCLCDVVRRSINNAQTLDILYDIAVPDIYRLLVSSALSLQGDECSMCHQDVLTHMETVIREIMCRISIGKIKDMCSKLEILFLKNDVKILDVHLESATEKWAPLECSSPKRQTQLVAMLTPVICSCPKQMDIPNIDNYLEKLTELSLRSPDDTTAIGASKCVAGLVNKYPTGDRLSDYLKGRHFVFDEMINSSATQNRKLMLDQWIWVTKALLLRGHNEGKTYFTKLLCLLSNEEIGQTIATGCEVILSDSTDVLSRAMNANVRIMYKQRLFTENIQGLVQGFHQAKEETKKNYLIVLSIFLKTLPKQVLLTELPPLFPLLVQSLLCDNIHLQLSTLTTLYDLISDAPEIVTKQINSLVNQMLHLCHHQASMKIRIGALKCLGKLTSLPEAVILPYKIQVTRELEPRLDDKKRLVRKEAVSARNSWFLLGQPGT